MTVIVFTTGDPKKHLFRLLPVPEGDGRCFYVLGWPVENDRGDISTIAIALYDAIVL